MSAFFDADHGRTAVVNGLLVPSVSHEVCNALSMTGRSTGAETDWHTVLGAAQSDRYPAPVMLLTGPSYQGSDGGSVVRCGLEGQLNALANGKMLER